MLTLSHITKTYGQRTVLSDVTLSVPEGSIFGLMGSNGAGKTTLIRIINRLIMPDAGAILFHGHPLSAGDIAHIGYLPEERGLYPLMTVEAQLLYLARLHGLGRATARARLDGWLSRLGMQDWRRRPLGNLSKGMQQKVQFVAAVLHEPTLLILDEPFSGFDALASNLLLEQLLYLQRSGVTIILSSHNIPLLQRFCTHIAMLHHSHLLFSTPLGDLLAAHPTETLYDIFLSTANAARP